MISHDYNVPKDFTMMMTYKNITSLENTYQENIDVVIFLNEQYKREDRTKYQIVRAS